VAFAEPEPQVVESHHDHSILRAPTNPDDFGRSASGNSDHHIQFKANVVFEEHDRLRPPSPHPRRLSEGGHVPPVEGILSKPHIPDHLQDQWCNVAFKGDVVFQESHERIRPSSPHPRRMSDAAPVEGILANKEDHGNWCNVEFAPGLSTPETEEKHERVRTPSPHPRRMSEGGQIPPVESILSKEPESGNWCNVEFKGDVEFAEQKERVRTPSPHPRRMSDGGQPIEGILAKDSDDHASWCNVTFTPNVATEDKHLRVRTPSPHPRRQSGGGDDLAVPNGEEPSGGAVEFEENVVFERRRPSSGGHRPPSPHPRRMSGGSGGDLMEGVNGELNGASEEEGEAMMNGA